MPNYNLVFSFPVDSFRAGIDEEASKAAQRAVGKEGQLLYDALLIYSKDKNEVEQSIRDAMDTVALRLADMSKLTLASRIYNLSLYAPDVAETQEVLEREIIRYVALKVVADWFTKRYPDTGNYYSEMAASVLTKVVTAARTRKMPER